LFLGSCGQNEVAKAPPEVVIVEKPEEIQLKANEQLNELIAFINQSGGRLNDSTNIKNYQTLGKIYEAGEYQPIWSDADHWRAVGDSLFFLIGKAKEYGLFPSDYHFPAILSVRNQFAIDPSTKKNVALWTKADLLLTDAFLQMAIDLNLGHLQKDSITPKIDSSLVKEKSLIALLQKGISTGQIKSTLEELEPQNNGYKALRAALPAFLDSAKFRLYTYVEYPNEDSLALIKQVAKRLQEDSILPANWNVGDSVTYIAAVKKYQQSKGIRTTGVAAQQTIGSLNSTDWEKFKRIAVNLDRYRQLPVQMPETYIWVNLPSFQLTVYDADTIALQSKIIVGASKTRTPVLNSEIVNFITYPQWTVPYSIIFKEMLPKIQKDISYLEKENLMVVDKNDSVINPATVDWFKLNKKYFPYLIRQRQGDDNSLGVMKFNFRNKYEVYLHDTNARGLFSRSSRAISHGCVRVQDWEKLSHFLVRNDEIRYHPDTLRAWISRQEKHIISDFSHVPIFIRYFTCEAKESRIKFYEDIYADDRMLSERYFKTKPIN
jgi:murein L,D-transpeptidase YcbB/YkuD